MKTPERAAIRRQDGPACSAEHVTTRAARDGGRAEGLRTRERAVTLRHGPGCSAEHGTTRAARDGGRAENASAHDATSSTAKGSLIAPEQAPSIHGRFSHTDPGSVLSHAGSA